MGFFSSVGSLFSDMPKNIADDLTKSLRIAARADGMDVLDWRVLRVEEDGSISWDRDRDQTITAFEYGFDGDVHPPRTLLKFRNRQDRFIANYFKVSGNGGVS